MRKKKLEPKVEEPKVYVPQKTEKELAVQKLSARGFIVTLESGVIMTKVQTPEQLKEFKKALADIKYNSSWGARVSKGDNNETGRAAESFESEGSEDFD